MAKNSPCIRCGKTRILAKSWKKEGVTYTQTVCPDKDCQKIVEQELKKRNEYFASLQQKSQERRKSIQLGRMKNQKRPELFKNN